jgi:hypothetical protein
MNILVPITDIEAFRASGIAYPQTVDGWRWLYRCREERGLESAFIQVGRRILVDVPRYVELVRKRDLTKRARGVPA